MTQASLFRYFVPATGQDANPIYQRSTQQWVDFLAGITIPFAWKPPWVESDCKYIPGADDLRIFFHCQVAPLPSGCIRLSDDENYPEIMAALYQLTAELIRDGWWITDCDVMGSARWDGRVELRIIAMRWQEGHPVDSSAWRYRTDPYDWKPPDKVALRCGIPIPL